MQTPRAKRLQSPIAVLLLLDLDLDNRHPRKALTHFDVDNLVIKMAFVMREV